MKISLAGKPLLIVSCTAVMWAQGGFQPGRAADYPSNQKVGPLRIAAVRYESDTDTRRAFGKVNPNEYGILPVLVIFENTGDDTLLLDRMKLVYQYSGNEISPTPPADIPYAIAPKRPNTGPSMPRPIPLPKKKNPLSAVELQTRAFAARTLLKGDTATGFFYFQTRHHRNAVLYITGIRVGTSGKELFYAEVPIDPASPDQP